MEKRKVYLGETSWDDIGDDDVRSQYTGKEIEKILSTYDARIKYEIENV